MVVMVVILALLGLGAVALREARTQQATTGSLRAQKQAYQAARYGLERMSTAGQSCAVKQWVPQMAASSLQNPTYTMGAESSATNPPGVFQVADPFGGADVSATRDNERVGNLEFMVTFSRPRPAEPPPGNQLNEGTGGRLMFYRLDADVLGWVNRDPSGTGLLVNPGTGGARKRIRAEVRVGPL